MDLYRSCEFSSFLYTHIDMKSAPDKKSTRVASQRHNKRHYLRAKKEITRKKKYNNNKTLYTSSIYRLCNLYTKLIMSPSTQYA